VAFWKQNGNRIERRREVRLRPEGLIAHYWTGGLSAPRRVQEIGLYGAAITAPDVYYPGTVIRIAMEDAGAAEAEVEAIQYAGVWGKVLRKVNDGFCVGFIFENRAERMHFRRFLEQVRRRGLLDETNRKKREKVRRAGSD
jgi:hypothetical protein